MSAITQRDPAYVAKVLPLLKLAMRGYFRSSVSGMEQVPDGGALMVGNHSGGLTPMDVPIIAVSFAEAFGAERPLHCLAHDMLFTGPAGPLMRKFGFANADRETAHEILTAGGVTIVFPGGDYDTFRPTLQGTVVDFNGRTGYVRTALRAGVPIVPVVSLGGQESQFFLTRGQWIGRRMPWRSLMRTDLFPIGIGFPFGLAPSPFNLPLPTRITTRVLAPIDPSTVLGEGVISSILEQTLAGGAFRLNEGYYHAYHAEIAAQKGQESRTLESARLAMQLLPSEEVLLRARLAARAAPVQGDFCCGGGVNGQGQVDGADRRFSGLDVRRV